MADKKKGKTEDSAASGAKPEKGAKKKAEVPEVAAEAAPPQVKPNTKSTKIPKLAKKNKSRLPRRVKKARQKAS